MTSAEFRCFMVQQPEVVRDLLLTENQLRTLEDVKYANMQMSSSTLADIQSISVPCASVKLRKLWSKGYLARRQQMDSTGGIYYAYTYCLIGDGND